MHALTYNDTQRLAQRSICACNKRADVSIDLNRIHHMHASPFPSLAVYVLGSLPLHSVLPGNQEQKSSTGEKRGSSIQATELGSTGTVNTMN